MYDTFLLVVGSPWERHAVDNLCEERSYGAFCFEPITAHAVARFRYELNPFRPPLRPSLGCRADGRGGGSLYCAVLALSEDVIYLSLECLTSY